MGVVMGTGAGYLDRQGPRDADVPYTTAEATGAELQAEFKKRPFGILRYQPGADGLGAMAKDVIDKSRYPGDPQGQAFVAGVKDVTKEKFAVIMDMLDDEVADPRFSKSTALALEQEGRYAEPVDTPIAVTFVSKR